MAGRSITFGGQTQFRPGGLTRIDASALTPIGLSATGIVHLLGEADGGAPGTEGVVVIDDPALAKALFRSGPLADAIRVAFNPSGDNRIPGGAFRVIAYKTNTPTQSTLNMPEVDTAVLTGTSTGASTTTVITKTGGGMTADLYIGRWLYAVDLDERRRIVDNTTTTITVAPGFSEAPGNTDAIEILSDAFVSTTRDYGAHTIGVSMEFEPGTDATFVVTISFEGASEQSPELCGDAYLRLKYVGGAVIDSGPVTISTGLSMSMNGSLTPSSNQYAGSILRFEDGTQRLIAANTAADPTVITLATGHGLSVSKQSDLEGTTVQVIDVDSADASITGASGAATDLTSAVLPVADNMALDFSTANLTTLQDLVDYINSNTNYEATVPPGINAAVTLLEDFDFDAGNTDVDIRFDDEIEPDDKGLFKQDLNEVIEWINDFSELATAERASAHANDGAGLPLVTGGQSGTARDVPVYFVGGSRGISTNSTFQAGFDALIQKRGNHVVPLISQDLSEEGNGSTATYESVAAQLKEHVRNCRTVGKNEMGGYIGFKGTKDDYIAQLASSNDMDVQIVPQQFNFLDVDGTMTLMDEWSGAVAAAGMRSGALEVGEPLTYKVINTNLVTQDSSWSPGDRTAVNQIIQAGGLFAETTSTGVVRWVRDMTSHISDDNIAFMEGNTREAVRFVAYDLRTSLEDRFTGVKATPANAAAIDAYVRVKMEEYLGDNIIVTSLDPETQTKIHPGYRYLRVSLEGNTATIHVEIFPCTGLVWTLNDITLQLPRIVAP